MMIGTVLYCTPGTVYLIYIIEPEDDSRIDRYTKVDI